MPLSDSRAVHHGHRPPDDVSDTNPSLARGRPRGDLRRTGSFAGARITAAVIQALTLVVIARALEPTAFALFALLFGVLQVGQAFFDGGCTQAIARHHREPSRVRAIFRAGRVLSLTAGIVASGALLVVAVAGGDPIVTALVPLGPWLAAERQAEVSSMLLASWGRTGAVALGVVGRRGLVFVACLAALAHPAAVLWAFSLTSLVSSAATSTLLARSALRLTAAGRPGIGIDRATAAMLLPYWATGLGLQVRQLDITVLTATAGVGTAAAFAPASRLIPPLRIVPTTYAQMLLARLARDSRALRPHELWWPTGVALVVFGAAALVAGPLLPVVLGTGYASAVLPLQISLLALAPATAASILTSSAQARGATRYAATCAWTSATVSLVLVAVLGLTLGAVGAAAATGLGFVVQATLLLVRRPRPGGSSPS